MEAIKDLSRKNLPGWLGVKAKRWVAPIRYWRQVRAARRSFQKKGADYKYPLLFVAGLPKSGTSWMEKMLASYSGYREIMIPEAIRHELENRGSHDFQLPVNLFERLQDVLAVLKLHVHGSRHNAGVLRESGVPYVIMYRDLRDVAVSHVFYVQRTPWHPEYSDYKGLSIEEGLHHFGETLLPEFVEWIRGWHANRDSENSLVVRYEDLLTDTATSFRKVARLFDLPDDSDTIQSIVDAHRFENLSGGRSRGEDGDESFFRKGVAGDWKNHFTSDLKRLYKERAGQALVEFGYEMDLDW